MQDTFEDTLEVKDGTVDWIFRPKGFTASKRIFVTHVILEVAKSRKGNGIFEVCVEKKAQGTEDFVSACFTKRSIKANSTEKTIHFVTPMPLTSREQLRIKFENKADGKANILVMWHL